jgi:broad specificity phosphatase PhoE
MSENALPAVYSAGHGEAARSLAGQHTGSIGLPLTERGLVQFHKENHNGHENGNRSRDIRRV